MVLVVAVIEMGTEYSTCAFSLTYPLARYQHEIDFASLIKCAKVDAQIRTPTCLLLDGRKQYVAFGSDAENRYHMLDYEEEQDDYYFFDRFTMSLHTNENVTRDMVLKDKTGKQCSAVEVFTLSIKAFVDRLKRMLLERGSGVSDDDILWVLTVPSVWTDSAKQLIRESAEKAGINPEKVLLVTEPEAAFTYCYYMPTTSLQGSKPGIMIKEPGTKSMVVDLGGAKADVTVLQQTYNGQLKVLCRATGDDCGGTSVDDRFCKMLEEIVGGNVITKVKNEDPVEWLAMLRNFRIKMKYLTTSNTKVTTLQFPLTLIEIWKRLHDKDFKSSIQSSSYGNEITLVSEKVRFKADLVIKLFTPTIDSIITLMKNTVSNRATNGVSHIVSNIVMVGGLSECPVIQDAVYKAFPDTQIIIPVDADISVFQGAILFGYRPDYSRSELCDEEGIGK